MFTLAFLGAEEQRGWWALGRGLYWAGVYTVYYIENHTGIFFSPLTYISKSVKTKLINLFLIILF